MNGAGGRTLAPFGRRAARITAREEHGAYVVLRCRDPYHCPHGRAVILRLNDRAIQNSFGRYW